tara:strand:- start:100725 stop:102173 length:1449 start_codon:yes stop_codon:yes gene_type:complete
MIVSAVKNLSSGLPRKIALFLACCAMASVVVAAGSSKDPYKLPDEIAEAEAFAIGYQAYIVGAVYARSQLLMEKDTHPGARLNAPINVFNVYPGLATPEAAIDFTPNNDTIYGLAWLDLSQGPVLITIPEVKGRYYTIQATDWALNTFSYIGSRVKSKAGTYAYVPPGWEGELPRGVPAIEASTTGVFLQARTVVEPEVSADIDPVVAQLKTYRLEPLNKSARYSAMDPDSPVPNPKLDNPIWKSLDFFNLLNRAWSVGGVREQDKEVVSLFAALGIGPGLSFKPELLTESQRKGLARAVQTGFARVLFHARENGDLRNGWRYSTNLGAYGDNRLLASTVAMSGYGANKAEEAMYIPVFTDDRGQPFTSDGQYRIIFPGDNLPPAEAFWSVTLYGLPGNQLRENPINRYAFGDRTPTLKRSADGSIELYVQRERPEGEKAGNWLPTGEGPFWMILRMYQPGEKALSGDYVPPPVSRRGAENP